LFLGTVEAARDPILGIVGHVLGVVVVKGVGRTQGNRRQHLVTQGGDGELGTRDPLLNQNLRVVLAGIGPRGDQLVHVTHFGHTDT